MKNFFLLVANTLEHAEHMRVVRNECRQFMTQDTREISREDQVTWFQALDRYHTRPFVGLTYNIHNGQATGAVIAYGLVRKIDSRWWISGGIAPEWRGQGFGRELFSALTTIVTRGIGRACWLEVHGDNERAFRLYASLGFVIDPAPSASNAPGVLVMRKRKEFR